MKRKLFFAAAAMIIAAGCANSADNNRYQVNIANASFAPEGTQIYIVDYDTSEKLDSAIVTDGSARFNGTIDKAVLARFVVGGDRGGMFILEPGVIEFADGSASGTPLNEAMEAFGAEVQRLSDLYSAASTQEEGEAIAKAYEEYVDSTMVANIENPIGYYLFLQSVYGMDRDEFDAAMIKYPHMASYKRIDNAAKVYERKDATGPGKKFTDFEITYDGSTSRLSDYVGNGNYTLVDFWASWCGPCIREIAVLKDLYAQYGPQGLQVVGVAVWDEPENTINAINRLSIPWPCIIDAQTIPTDIYGILGIPCIILIAPDGTIIARDLQDEELRAAVAAVFPAETETTVEAN